jgi:hypothetical protein
MGSTKFMRLSLMKAAHEVIFGTAWQEIRVRSHGKPGQAG